MKKEMMKKLGRRIIVCTDGKIEFRFPKSFSITKTDPGCQPEDGPRWGNRAKAEVFKACHKIRSPSSPPPLCPTPQLWAFDPQG